MLKKVSENVFELSVFLTPGAKKESINEIVKDAKGKKMLKVSVFAHPEHNKANESLVKLLSKYFHVPKSSIQIKTGQKSRKKTLLIINLKGSSSFK